MGSAVGRTVTRAQNAIARHKADPLTSVVLTVPVFVAYHLGVLVIDARDGVDWISGFTLWLVDESVPAYAAVTLAAALALLLAAWIQGQRGRLRPAALLPTIAESSMWALVMAITIGWATHAVTEGSAPGAALRALGELLPVAVGSVAELGTLDKLILAAGAGFHEEAVFRVGVLSGGALALQRGLGFGRARALLVALPVSAIAFALAHHFGPYADAVTFAALVFRTLSGVFLAGIYLLRGFAIAVYTHAFYDALVFFVL